MLAIDPSSPFSGGALLGDRVRMERARDGPRGVHPLHGHPRAPRRAVLGHPAGAAGARRRRVRRRARRDRRGGPVRGRGGRPGRHHVVLLAPGMGDGIQAAKAGILEIADLFVVNKADRDGADTTVRELRQVMAHWRRRGAGPTRWRVPVVRTVAATGRGRGRGGRGHRRPPGVAAATTASWRAAPAPRPRRDRGHRAAAPCGSGWAGRHRCTRAGRPRRGVVDGPHSTRTPPPTSSLADLTAEPGPLVSAVTPHTGAMATVLQRTTPATRFRASRSPRRSRGWGSSSAWCLKYLVVENPVGVPVFGPVHGAVFVAYVLVSLVTARPLRWSAGTTVLALVASVPPFGSVVFERWAAAPTAGSAELSRDRRVQHQPVGRGRDRQRQRRRRGRRAGGPGVRPAQRDDLDVHLHRGGVGRGDGRGQAGRRAVVRRPARAPASCSRPTSGPGGPGSSPPRWSASRSTCARADPGHRRGFARTSCYLGVERLASRVTPQSEEDT